ncbi:MAG: 3'-5' exoribonuclease [Planctomycetes bacterium]|nr:3'-5' exoribonuclease [Planctomycetota bacterium]
MEFPLVILDTETATLSGAPHLLELGAVLVQDGEVVDRFEAFVRPEVPIAPEATEFHGIDEAMVRDAEPAAVVLERFRDWAGDRPLVAHNADFDARVLAFEYARARLAPPPGWLIDTLKLSRRLIPESPDHKLATLCEHLGLEEGLHHRALADAVWCWKVLEACALRMQPPPASAVQLVQACGQPVTLILAAPRVRGLLKPRHRSLEHACREREPVTLIYGDETASPVPLSVLPRVLYDQGDRSYLEAECLRSGTIKTYRLDRVHQVRTSP